MYKAVVSRIQTRPLPGADRLLIGACGQYQVIVGIDTQDGELGVFFEQDGQLSIEFATQNDLVRRKDANGNAAGGMFEENRRIKAIKLRGARSEGFWTPLSSFSYTGYDLSSLREGDQFDELNGHRICGKYMTPATTRAMRNQFGIKARRENRMFAKHIETGKFKMEQHLIPDDATITITEKLHGTSFRYGHVLDEQPIRRNPVWRWITRLLRMKQTTKVWKHLVGTRNVVLSDVTTDGFYGADAQFRRKSVDGLVLHKGEVVYGEIVGYTDTGTPIMPPQSTLVLKDKAVTAKYGELMNYTYGCMPGQCKLYLYRITQVNEDGYSVELSWPQVKKRARELGVSVVPELPIEPERELALVVQALTEDGTNPLPSLVDSRHIREGVVVRWDSEHGVGWLKNKGFTFGLLEGYLKERDDVVDLEESA